MKWLDKVSLGTLLLPAVLLALAPFSPEPHLVEKVRMLSQGTLQRPIDIFDLLMHSAPMLLVLLKLIRLGQQRADGEGRGV